MQIFEGNGTLYENCEYYLNWHRQESIKKVLLEVAENTDPDMKRDFYGKGSVIENFQNKIAKVLGKKYAVFMPSGVMAQQIALRIWANKKNINKVLCHPTSHLEKHEFQAYSFLHNLSTVHVGNKDHLIELDDLEKIQEQVSALVLELPHRENGGITYDYSHLTKISDWAKKRNIALHMDGARLWECKSFYNKDYSEICDLFDSVYVSFYKGIGGIAGAILAFNDDDLLNECRIWLRRHGGNLISMYPYVVSADLAFCKRVGRMELYHKKAKMIASMLETMQDVSVFPKAPHTNMMHIRFSTSKDNFVKKILAIAEKERICMFDKIREIENDNSVLVELNVGDATLEIEDEVLHKLFVFLASK